MKYDGNPTLAGDANAWCASFVNYCLREAGYSPAPTGFMGSHFCHNNPDKFVKISKPVYGAIRYCRRDGGGHVCFVYGTLNGKMVVLGGNQSDTILFEHPDSTYGGVSFYVPIAYQKFAEAEQDKELPEIDIIALKMAMGDAVPKSLKSKKNS
ncbi:TIGR02594 family protein [Undibacterium jejuense]|uniref:TIGR02594 family protein n=1 Tax=Undibacterium jejuense TaxID=1344949 RepID=A0A923HK60_9BURK|nr:TIGR02594 family protein [Undibacterium jejuense]